MQALECCERDSKKLADTVYEVERASLQTGDYPPIEVVNRLLRSCSLHNDVKSLHKLSNLLQKTNAPKNSDTFSALNDCFTYCNAQSR